METIIILIDNAKIKAPESPKNDFFFKIKKNIDY